MRKVLVELEAVEEEVMVRVAEVTNVFDLMERNVGKDVSRSSNRRCY